MRGGGRRRETNGEGGGGNEERRLGGGGNQKRKNRLKLRVFTEGHKKRRRCKLGRSNVKTRED